MKMVHVEDPREQIWRDAGDLNGFDMADNLVLLGIYKRGEKTLSGLYLPDQTRKEDEYQGKVGLILKMGPKAFVDDADRTFERKGKVGEWVATWVTDGRKAGVNKQLCRIVADTEIRIWVDDPDSIY